MLQVNLEDLVCTERQVLRVRLEKMEARAKREVRDPQDPTVLQVG
jgi:hypothetical protein